jgi:hypothetical protein
MKFEIQRIADADLGWVLPTGALAVPEPTAATLAAQSPITLPIETPKPPAIPVVPHRPATDH